MAALPKRESEEPAGNVPAGYLVPNATCTGCRAPIVWVKTVRGKNLPLDPRPSCSPDAGNFGLTADGVALYVRDSARTESIPSRRHQRLPDLRQPLRELPREAAVSALNGEPHMLSMALLYAGAGIAVFPVNDQKAPRTPPGTKERPGGFHYATTEREQVEQWWMRWPNAGIGTPDFDVVDVDLYKPECAPTWKRIKPLIPVGTPQNKTARGGLQFIFKPGTLADDGPIGPGVDKRYAWRNYVVMPPSSALGGRYEAVVNVLTRKPKPAPDFGSTDAGSDFAQLALKMEAGEQVDTERNKGAWWRAVEILRTLPPGTDLAPVRDLVQSWVNANCTGDLSEVDVAKQVRGAARTVARERENGTRSGQNRFDQTRRDDSEPRISWRRLSGVEMRSIVFRDKPLLQADAFHGIVGRKGAGKGTVLAEIASRVTRGELGEKTGVVWIGSEDSAEVDIKPRIVATEGDPSRVLVVERGWIQLPGDIPEIEHAMEDLGEVGMLLVDPVGNHIAGKNSNSETDIRDAIGRLNKLADEHRCMVFGVRHLSEKECSRGVLAAILGSSAWVHVPRAVLAVVRDDEDPQLSHVQCVAGNRLPPDTPGRMFRIEGVKIPGWRTRSRARCGWATRARTWRRCSERAGRSRRAAPRHERSSSTFSKTRESRSRTPSTRGWRETRG